MKRVWRVLSDEADGCKTASGLKLEWSGVEGGGDRVRMKGEKKTWRPGRCQRKDESQIESARMSLGRAERDECELTSSSPCPRSMFDRRKVEKKGNWRDAAQNGTRERRRKAGGRRER